jgi:hypothetical protein
MKIADVVEVSEDETAASQCYEPSFLIATDRFSDRFPVKAIMIVIITMYVCSLCGQITTIYCVN